MELFKNTNFDFLGKQKLFIGLSLVLTAVGLASWISKGGLQYGIDFTGGANVTVRFAHQPPVDKIRSAVAAKLPGELSVQEVSGTNEVIVGTGLKSDTELQAARGLMVEALHAAFGTAGGKFDFNNGSAQSLADRLRDPLQRAGVPIGEQELVEVSRRMMEFKNSPPRSGLLTSLDELRGVQGVTPTVLSVMKQECGLASFSIRGSEVIGPKIGAEMRNKAVLATLYALGGMLVYIAFRFEWIYGLAAVIAVFHDVIITLGLFSLFNKEISLNVIAALLTLVGYSMNDTIVVFDRIREHLKLSRKGSFAQLVNDSINETLSRTVLTSGLTLVAAVCLLVFGGPVLNGFSFALVVGILIGTYSSIFIASPILVFWYNYAEKGRRGGRTAEGGKR
ncbi:MAG TPA: protein translocase subunit SecF [Bryobacteraceae bacterium]|nr:protein translocase subunit SecF [Bryobacteraceae bacterium]HPT25624.1 protein translocase subunit SecF [Bryobacteraceae bacterium]